MKGIDVGAGVIDHDYIGEVGIILFNHKDDIFTVNSGDRIAQLILEVIINPSVIQVNELGVSDRGYGGFGSTGK
jgi:dUTP pyrophosphatase